MNRFMYIYSKGETKIVKVSYFIAILNLIKNRKSFYKYKIGKSFSVLCFKLIKYLFKYTNRHFFKSITVSMETDGGGFSGVQYFIIDKEPHPVNNCKIIGKIKQ